MTKGWIKNQLPGVKSDYTGLVDCVFSVPSHHERNQGLMRM